MTRLWASIERWGPLIVSLLTFLAFIGYAWHTDQRIARLEGRTLEISRNQDEALLLRERAKTLEDRILRLEGDAATQVVYNQKAMADIARLQAKGD